MWSGYKQLSVEKAIEYAQELGIKEIPSENIVQADLDTWDPQVTRALLDTSDGQAYATSLTPSWQSVARAQCAFTSDADINFYGLVGKLRKYSSALAEYYGKPHISATMDHQSTLSDSSVYLPGLSTEDLIGQVSQAWKVQEQFGDQFSIREGFDLPSTALYAACIEAGRPRLDAPFVLESLGYDTLDKIKEVNLDHLSHVMELIRFNGEWGVDSVHLRDSMFAYIVGYSDRSMQARNERLEELSQVPLDQGLDSINGGKFSHWIRYDGRNWDRGPLTEGELVQAHYELQGNR